MSVNYTDKDELSRVEELIKKYLEEGKQFPPIGLLNYAERARLIQDHLMNFAKRDEQDSATLSEDDKDLNYIMVELTNLGFPSPLEEVGTLFLALIIRSYYRDIIIKNIEFDEVTQKLKDGNYNFRIGREHLEIGINAFVKEINKIFEVEINDLIQEELSPNEKDSIIIFVADYIARKLTKAKDLSKENNGRDLRF